MAEVLVLDYPPGYSGPRPIEDQIREIAWRFNLWSSRETLDRVQRGLPPPPFGTEGWFAVPKADALARLFFPGVVDPVERYRRAVARAFRVLGLAQDFADRTADELILPEMRRQDRSARARDLLTVSQPGEISIIAAQLGRLRRGEDVGRMYCDALEYGLGVLEAVAIILTHPDRLSGPECLDLDCPGDAVYRLQGRESVPSIPCFSHTGRGIIMGLTSAGNPNPRNGPATWFPLLDR